MEFLEPGLDLYGKRFFKKGLNVNGTFLKSAEKTLLSSTLFLIFFSTSIKNVDEIFSPV